MDLPADPQFNARMDEILAVANAQLRNGQPVEQVAGSITFAAAAFNAWMCLALSKDAEWMAKGRAQIVNDLTERFRKMLEDNYETYLRDYATHKTSKPRPTQ